MGGSVGLQSDGITGSQFWIELPAAKKPVSGLTLHPPD